MRIIDVADRKRIYLEMKNRELRCSFLMMLMGFVISMGILTFQISFELNHLYHYIVTFVFLIYISLSMYSNDELSRECSEVKRKQKEY